MSAHLEPAESRVVRLEREVREASAAHQRRVRRNAAEAPVPKVYGMVSSFVFIRRIAFKLLWQKHPNE